MAKLPSFAEVAAGVERVGRAMQEGVLRWDPALGGALVAAVDDLKKLLHSARTWSPAEDRRAAARTEELSRFAPVRPFAPTPSQSGQRSAIAGSAFLATEAANIAAGLELLSTRAGAPDTASNLLRRVRALRGVAGVKTVPPLADVLEATEDVTRRLESGERTLGSETQQLLEAAAEYLRVISSALRFEGDFDAPSAARDAFVAAQTKWANHDSDAERVVPISTLFYGDEGPGVVEASPNPPTSTEDRFRLELVGHGEHLRRMIDTVRESDASSAPRAHRDLARALRDLEGAAHSFGRRDVADFVTTHLGAAERADTASLASLDELAEILSQPGAHSERLMARLRGQSADETPPEPASMAPTATPVLAEPVDVAPESAAAGADANVVANAVADAVADIDVVTAADAEPAVAAMPMSEATEAEREPALQAATEPETFEASKPDDVTAPETPPAPTPLTPPQAIAAAASALIDMSLAALESLTSAPWLEPSELPEEAVVPIESLLYRGTAALDRAIEIRDELRRSESRADEDALDELFDLLELARAE